MKNRAVHLALNQQQCMFNAMMAELRTAANTLEGEELLNSMREIEQRHCN